MSTALAEPWHHRPSAGASGPPWPPPPANDGNTPVVRQRSVPWRVLRRAGALGLVIGVMLIVGIEVTTPDGSGFAQPLDSAVARSLKAPHSPFLASVLGVVNWAGWIGIVALAAVVVGLRLHRLGARRTTAAVPLLAVACAEVVARISSSVVGRPRPDSAATALTVGHSFPSAPVATVVALTVSARLLLRRLRRPVRTDTAAVLGGAVVAAVCFAPLLTGANWLSDVLAGVLLGGWTGWLVVRLSNPDVVVAHRRLSRTARWSLAGAALVMVVPVGASYVHALRASGFATSDARTVDWLRTHGMSSVVDRAESWWLWSHLPSTSSTRTALPAPPLGTTRGTTTSSTSAPLAGPGPQPAAAQGSAGSSLPKPQPPPTVAPSPTTSAAPPPAGPATMTPVVQPALPGEGVWTFAQAAPNGASQIETASIRPDLGHPDLVATLAWMNATTVKFTLVAGTREPVGTAGPWGATVPANLRPTLLAAFNSGYKMKDTPGGAVVNGLSSKKPLLDRIASLVVRSDGSATVGMWGRDVTMAPDVVAVRQNLRLIIDGGQLADGLRNNVGQHWGSVKNALPTWRSGIGVDANGNLVYASGNELTLDTLATALQRGGAVRAMELDIHKHMVTYNLFTHTTSDPTPTGHKLSPDMTESASRYLRPDQRDFIAVFGR